MKIIASTILAFSLIAGTVAPAAAYSGSLIERLDSDQRGGHAG